MLASIIGGVLGIISLLLGVIVFMVVWSLIGELVLWFISFLWQVFKVISAIVIIIYVINMAGCLG